MKNGRGWWALAGMIVGPVTLLFSLYAAAYYWLVKPVPEKYDVITDPDKPPMTMLTVSPFYPEEWMPSFFDPIQRIDRRWIRPKTWTPPDP
ncbi:MAG TPA: hypothetical protein VHB77_14370 [Planctomycetaceae bacterium]|nr:hypothetical protein [Planctomycetaceae bacterium]